MNWDDVELFKAEVIGREHPTLPKLKAVRVEYVRQVLDGKVGRCEVVYR